MEQCWDANPLKRSDTVTLFNKISEIKSYYQNKPDELPQKIIQLDKKTINIMSSKIFTSNIHNFENLPEPKNATETFYTTRSYDFSISDNTSNHSKSSKQYTSINFKDNDSKESSRLFKKLKMENDEVQNNPNLHSE
ncbi:hypothetical protein RhiirA4_406261 [Rhizophagus irregularis]|uniref:Serine-threonine/tyrosine-protein kinase catalytic domain-containing protein n=1 Tax=Rhizophagus irregularis TaxID=588596 RepID=A0A2I1GUA1_9GLOM|nr:hypothetical protein RhiirA4_406261 [Rhizophagus irregularis]